LNELFLLLSEGKARLRIFFRQNINKYTLEEIDKDNAYTKLYYQFIKHSFGLVYAPVGGDYRLRLLIDQMPIHEMQRRNFIKYLCELSEYPRFKEIGVSITPENVVEVDSKKHIPLQVMDLVLGAICFRLNDKHKQKDPITGKRGVRTIKKEELYKYIRSKICEVTKRNFNIGCSTSIEIFEQKWSFPYLHWNFVPTQLEEDKSLGKHYSE